MEKIYSILTWGIFWIMLLSSALLIFINVPNIAKLKNYKNSRIILSAIYLLMALANLMQIIGGNENAIWYSRIITLWIGCSMAPSITIINITLLNPSFFSYKKILKELILPFIFTVIIIFSYEFLSSKSLVFLFSYYLFLIYYIFVLIKFTLMLIKEFQNYNVRFDNFFSESETNHLNWLLKTQFFATFCGIIAFVSLFLPLWFTCLFSLFLIIFYSYYTLRFINYTTLFSEIENIVEESSNKQNTVIQSFNPLESAVIEWENRKHFVRTDINIEFVAKELCTNRTYLSTYINTYKKKSFKEWISDLRINEAQLLLLSEPQLSVSDVAYRVGFTDKSNFTNRFSKNTGESPKKWREKNLNPS